MVLVKAEKRDGKLKDKRSVLLREQKRDVDLFSCYVAEESLFVVSESEIPEINDWDDEVEMSNMLLEKFHKSDKAEDEYGQMLGEEALYTGLLLIPKWDFDTNQCLNIFSEKKYYALTEGMFIKAIAKWSRQVFAEGIGYLVRKYKCTPEECSEVINNVVIYLKEKYNLNRDEIKEMKNIWMSDWVHEMRMSYQGKEDGLPVEIPTPEVFEA